MRTNPPTPAWRLLILVMVASMTLSTMTVSGTGLTDGSRPLDDATEPAAASSPPTEPVVDVADPQPRAPTDPHPIDDEEQMGPDAPSNADGSSGNRTTSDHPEEQVPGGFLDPVEAYAGEDHRLQSTLQGTVNDSLSLGSMVLDEVAIDLWVTVPDPTDGAPVHLTQAFSWQDPNSGGGDGGCTDSDGDGTCDNDDPCPEDPHDDCGGGGGGGGSSDDGRGITDCGPSVIGDYDGDGVPNSEDVDDDCDRIADDLERSQNWDPLDRDSDNDGLPDHMDLNPSLHQKHKLYIEIQAIEIRQNSNNHMDPYTCCGYEPGDPYLENAGMGLGTSPSARTPWGFSFTGMTESEHEDDCNPCYYGAGTTTSLGKKLDQDITSWQYDEAKPCTYCPPVLQLDLPLKDHDGAVDDDYYGDGMYSTETTLYSVTDGTFEKNWVAIQYHDSDGEWTAWFSLKLKGNVDSCALKVIERAHRFNDRFITRSDVGEDADERCI